MSALTFDGALVRQAIAETINATSRKPSMGEQIEYGVYDDNFKEIPGKMQELRAKTKPALWLVKDDGVYLMANTAWFSGMTIAYAKGYNPETDRDVWEKSRAALGGDDFCEALPLDLFEDRTGSHKSLKINITTKQIRVTWVS